MPIQPADLTLIATLKSMVLMWEDAGASKQAIEKLKALIHELENQ